MNKSNVQPAVEQPPVRTFMSQVLFTIDDKMTLTKAAEFFATHKLTTVPVVTHEGEILGVLSDFQLLRFLLRSKSEGAPGTVGDFHEDLDPVVTINEGESVVHAFQLMIQSANHRIYTIQDGKLTGALSPKDFLLYMAGGKSKFDQAVDPNVQQQIESILKELYDTRKLLSDFQAMFNDSPYLMHSVDMNGKIVAANRMIHCVLGYNDGELVGKTLRQIYPPENYKAAMNGLQTVKALGFHPVVSATMVKKDGSIVRVDIASTLKKTGTGEAEATITVGRLSDSYRMVNYLQRAAQIKTNPFVKPA
jgi:PAS domain S-box-containing protein